VLTDSSRRQSFPSLDGRVYLNTAAEGVPPQEVGEALQAYFRDKQLGMDGRDRHFAQWAAAKALVAEFYGLTADEIGICSNSSEAYNLASLALRPRAGDEVIINDLDFPAGATPWLQEGYPAKVRLWQAREGVLHSADLAALLGPKTRLVTVSLVSFFNGFKIDLPAVVETVRKHSPALLAVDVTQALGRIPLDLSGADLIVSSTHKWILASHGGGVVPAGGWFHLEDAFGPSRFERAVSRPGAAGFTVGMPNFPAVYAIRAALDYIKAVGVAEIDRAAGPLVSACLEGLSSLPVELISPRDPSSLAGIVAFRHPKWEELVRRLRSKNIHVMGHAGRIRVALHGYNTPEDVEMFLRELRAGLKDV